MLTSHTTGHARHYLRLLGVDMEACTLPARRRGPWLVRSLLTLVDVDRRARREGAGEVRLLFLADVMPWVALPRWRAPLVGGILYRLEPYQWGEMRWWQRWWSVATHWLLARSGHVGPVYTLNDGASAAVLNRRFHTDKFRRLPDPAPDAASLAEPRSVARDKVRHLLHFGGLTRRKGTLTLLDALSLMSAEERAGYHLVLAGPAYPDVAERLHRAAQEPGVTWQPGWRSDEELMTLCRQADAIVIPYNNVWQSSGLLGWSAASGTPVLASSGGLLGKLVRRHGLGCTCSATPEGVLGGLRGMAWGRVDGSDYLRANTAEAFAKTFLEPCHG